VFEDDDKAQVERCKTGDQRAFAVLVNRYHRPLYNAAYRVLGNAEDASDVTQLVFLKLAERLDEYDSQYKFFSWIYRIAVNESLNLRRSHEREVLMGDDVDTLMSDGNEGGNERSDPERRCDASELGASVQRGLMQLKLDDRVVLTLRHFSELSYREIADVLEVDEKTVKSRLFEARRRLGLLLKDFQTH
jgi:RNA polymerase sigma-70 factor (ECF subfamily)